MATSPAGSAAVQLADAASDAAKARVAYARSLRYPLLVASGAVSNLTRNLGAEGFNFPTGVSGFVIPESVGPFAVYDARISMSQPIFDLSAIRQMRSVAASYNATKADASTHRATSASQVAHDYLAVLQADASIETARSGVTQEEAMVRRAQGQIDHGEAADVELTQTQLRLSSGRRKLSAAENSAALSRLQLLDDLGLDFHVQIVPTDKLTFAGDEMTDIDAAINQAVGQRPELQSAAQRELQARTDASAIQAQRLPTISAFGDVGSLNAVETHTVGISARITVFDGGRLKAQEAESAATARRYQIQQRDLRRKIELDVRRAFVNLQTAASQARSCMAAVTLSNVELEHVQRSYDGGIATNAELIEAQSKVAQAHDEQYQAFFSWNQARVDLAEATGTITSLTMK